MHRDIKPDNVMVRSNGLAKLLDFGIAKLSAPTESSDATPTALQSRTRAGVLIGTPQFMSPEQARGLRVDHQSDIFSLGVVMHQMLSGESPFAGDTVSDALAAVLTREPRRLTEVPAAFADIVSRTLQKATRDRYGSAKDLLRDLTVIQTGVRLSGQPGPPHRIGTERTDAGQLRKAALDRRPAVHEHERGRRQRVLL